MLFEIIFIGYATIHVGLLMRIFSPSRTEYYPEYERVMSEKPKNGNYLKYRSNSP